MNAKREALRKLVEDRCLLEGDFTLSTGAKSSFYFDCKRATLDGETLSHITTAFLEEIHQLAEIPKAIGGLTMGADFVSAAVAMRAFEIGAKTRHASIVRKERKEHGTRNFIENELSRGTTIVVVDDVITSGSSIIKACEKFLDEGYKIVGILALVDREAGGVEKLQRAFGCEVRAVFRKSDFPKLVRAIQESEHSKQRLAGAA